MNENILKIIKIANELDGLKIFNVSDDLDPIIEKIVRKSEVLESQIPAKQPQIQKDGIAPAWVEEKEFVEDKKEKKKDKKNGIAGGENFILYKKQEK